MEVGSHGYPNVKVIKVGSCAVKVAVWLFTTAGPGSDGNMRNGRFGIIQSGITCRAWCR